MLDRILIGASSTETTDPNFKNVTLLLHGDGSNGAQNNTFIDSSTNNFTITRNGNTTQGSFSPYGSNWSNYFDGNGDYLTVPDNAAFDFGTGDFTVECWVFHTSSSGNNVYAEHSYSGFALYRSGTKLAFAQADVANLANSTNDIPVNQWVHVAVTRSGTTLRLWINGVQEASVTNSTNFSSTTDPKIGTSSGNLYMVGYISNLRVLKGTALYTSAFTPSTTPLTAITNTSLLTCADNRFRDGSTNNFTITRNGDVKVTNFAPFAPSSAYSTTTNGGSAYFDGGGDSLSLASASAFALGSGDFTLEYWVYYNSLSTNQTSLDFRNGSQSDNAFSFYQSSTGGDGKLYVATATTNRLVSNAALSANTWTHIAVVRSSGVSKLYINGVAQSQTWSDTTDWSTNKPLRIGSDYTGSNNNLNGFLSGVRVLKGTAQYTADFTPPASPPTAITNTSLLLNATNAAIFDNSMKNDLETVGNAQISTSVKKFGTGSMYFDGSGDYLSIPPTQEFSYGSGSFTVELWFYASSVSGSEIPIYKQHNSGAAAGDTVEIRIASSKVVGYIENTSFGGSTTLSANTWYHVAYVRNGSTCTLYLNGVSEGSASNSANLSTPTTVRVGTNQVASSFYTGYVDDVRVSKGIARYTANFTAPTAPFPNK